MTTIIQCSACQRRLKVPENVVGKAVKCPICGAQFTATAAEGDSAPPPLPPADDEGIQREAPPLPPAKTTLPPLSRRKPEPPDDDEASPRRSRRYDEDDDDDDRPRRRRIALDRPVTGLVLPPAICLLVTGILGVLANCFQTVIALTRPDLLQNNPFGAAAPPWASAVSGVLFSGVAIGTIAGSITMMKTRLYGLSMVGAVLGMINIGNCCCALGLPFGIWAIIVLCRSDVKDAFYR